MNMMTAYCNSRNPSLLREFDELGNGGSVSKLVYVVTMYRYGDREKHSYVLGVFSNENTAHEWGDKEKDYRGGKYEAEIIKFCVDSPTDFLKVKHV